VGSGARGCWFRIVAGIKCVVWSSDALTVAQRKEVTYVDDVGSLYFDAWR
jgi:hypothetical protein